jgi:hypothetical protein
MKYFLLFLIFFVASTATAQKYVLLDEHFAQPVSYTDKITSADNFNDLFPVEKKMLPQFINALEEIVAKLSTKGRLGDAKQYQIGCAKFVGLTVPLATGDRLDYVLTSDCDNVKITMHLSDAKVKNVNNAFFIQTWIKYIKSYIK